MKFGNTLGLNRRIALLSLASGMVALYLALWKLGYMGPLVCAGDNSAAGQTSPYVWKAVSGSSKSGPDALIPRRIRVQKFGR